MWHYVNWHSLQVQGVESLGENSSDGKQSVPVRLKHIQDQFSCSDKLTDFYTHSPYGMTYALSMAQNGLEKSTSSLEGFPVKTYRQQEKEPGLKVNAQGSGERWREPLAKYDHLSCSWKTLQYSLLGGLEEFSETFPRWGTMQSGVCWEREMLVLNIGETESGFWATPTVFGNNNRKGTSKKAGDGLATQVRKIAMYPTPVASDIKKVGIKPQFRDGKLRQDTLPYVVEHGGKLIPQTYPTPDASNGTRGVQVDWTPKRKSGHKAQYSLNQAVADQEQTYKKKSLNPSWVEWLMGWPIGWTDLKPLGMDKFHSVQQWHLIFCLQEH